MTATDVDAVRRKSKPRRSLGLRLVRLLGWALIAAGVVILLYLAYSLFFTNLTTAAAQSDLLEEWELEVGAVEGTALTELPGEASPEPTQPPATVDPGEALAVLQFARPGSETAPVRDEPLFVVEGVALANLTRGPGHYPGTALPGEPGNFAVAGHRTTYGAPFFDLDDLAPGDQVLVTARDGVRYTYEVVQADIVRPTDLWVLDADPLGLGEPMLTLTTCHPRFSASQRLVVFARMVG